MQHDYQSLRNILAPMRWGQSVDIEHIQVHLKPGGYFFVHHDEDVFINTSVKTVVQYILMILKRGKDDYPRPARPTSVSHSFV